MKLAAGLLDILACPACHSALRADAAAEELVCTGCARAYPVRDDIPVLLLDEARTAESAAPESAAPGSAAPGSAAPGSASSGLAASGSGSPESAAPDGPAVVGPPAALPNASPEGTRP